jgi:hypothetical protein
MNLLPWTGMSSAEVKFHGHLRRDVDNAGKRFERATKKVLAMTTAPEPGSKPDLADAAEMLSSSMHTYVRALRRLAHYAAHQAPEHLTHA